MPASARYAISASGGERWRSAVAVAILHLAIGAALISGLHYRAAGRPDEAPQLIDIRLDPPPPPPPPRVEPPPKPLPKQPSQSGAAPRAPDPAPPGGTPGPVERAALPAPTVPIVFNPVPAGGGGSGASSSFGAGSGGGTGGTGSGSGTGAGDGNGDGDGGSDLEQIAGSIRNADYPPGARAARISGRVEFRFTVGPDGRVSHCAVTRSSGSPELDATTCRLVTERFRYRPSTDARGRPIADEVEGEQVWTAGGR